MRLFQRFFKDTVKLTRTETPDGYGGVETEWEESEIFQSAIVTNSTPEEVFAEKQEGSAIFSIVTQPDVVLRYHDLVRQDGKYYRITADSTFIETPVIASFAFRKATAEWLDEAQVQGILGQTMSGT